MEISSPSHFEYRHALAAQCKQHVSATETTLEKRCESSTRRIEPRVQDGARVDLDGLMSSRLVHSDHQTPAACDAHVNLRPRSIARGSSGRVDADVHMAPVLRKRESYVLRVRTLLAFWGEMHPVAAAAPGGPCARRGHAIGAGGFDRKNPPTGRPFPLINLEPNAVAWRGIGDEDGSAFTIQLDVRNPVAAGRER
jgi:hypothetical protein